MAVEWGGGIWTSSDSGVTWTQHAEMDPGMVLWTIATSSADGQKLTAFGPGNYFYISSNTGLTWTRHLPTVDFASMASSADGNRLVGVTGGEYIYVSTDQGVTWTQQGTALGRTNWVSVACSSDCSRLIVAPANGTLYASSDFGATWTAGMDTEYWASVAISGDGTRVAALTASQSYIYIGDWTVP